MAVQEEGLRQVLLVVFSPLFQEKLTAFSDVFFSSLIRLLANQPCNQFYLVDHEENVRGSVM